MIKSILVTGSAGFLGRHLVNYLTEKEHAVVEYDIAPGFPFSEPRDILDYEQLRSAFQQDGEVQIDEVYHLAAQAHVGPGEQDPYRDLDINGKGMLNVLRCVEEFEVPMVYSSSGAVYGRTGTELNVEDVMVRPTSNYGCSKRLGEMYLQKWVLNTGIDARIVRFSSIYGPGRGKHGAVNAFIGRAVEGKTLTVYGDGSQTRDMIHWRDACRGLELALEKGKPGEIYNIGYGLAHSILQVAEIVHNLTGAPIEFIEGHEFTKFDVKKNKFDSSRARLELGFEAEIDLKRGIQLTLSEHE